MEKRCPKCNIVKPIDNFSKSYCIECNNIYRTKKHACECGKYWVIAHKARHLKSNYHKKRVEIH